MPRGDMEDSEAIRRREMLASMGLPSGMEVDSTSIAPAPRAVADDLEMGSSPMFSMHPVDTPARLRGGGGSSAAQAPLKLGSSSAYVQLTLSSSSAQVLLILS